MAQFSSGIRGKYPKSLVAPIQFACCYIILLIYLGMHQTQVRVDKRFYFNEFLLKLYCIEPFEWYYGYDFFHAIVNESYPDKNCSIMIAGCGTSFFMEVSFIHSFNK